MRKPLILGVVCLLPTLAGCETTTSDIGPAPPVDQRYARHCHWRPFDAGLCDRPTNFRLFEAVLAER